MRGWQTLFRGNFRRMADSAEPCPRDGLPSANHAEPRPFDPDAWGASPHWDAGAEQSVYDDGALDRELVPLARWVMPGEATSD